MNEFGNKIKELRGKKSIREAARGIGISHTYLDSLEKGYDPRTGKDRKPTIEVINKISVYYKYDFGELVSLANIFVSLNDLPEEQKVKQTIEFAEKLSKQQIRMKENVNKNLQSIIDSDMPVVHTRFLANSLSYMNSQENEDIEFMTALFQSLIFSKGNKDKDSYNDIISEFDNFLKLYLEIEDGDQNG